MWPILSKILKNIKWVHLRVCICPTPEICCSAFPPLLNEILKLTLILSFVFHSSFCSGSLIHNNYEALVSNIERLTHHDAMTLLRITHSDAQRRSGRAPRTQRDYMRAMENMGEVLLVRAIMGTTGIAPTSYEVWRRERERERGGGVSAHACVCIHMCIHV